MNVNESFLGTGWSFPPSFNHEAATVELVSNVEDINQSLNILLSTSLGERVMQPEYGCNLEDYLFESLSSTMIGYIKDRVMNSIIYYEPRIRVEKIEVTSDDSVDLFEGRFTIIVVYYIHGSNTRIYYFFDCYYYVIIMN